MVKWNNLIKFTILYYKKNNICLNFMKMIVIKLTLISKLDKFY